MGQEACARTDGFRPPATGHELDRRNPPAILHPPEPRAGEKRRGEPVQPDDLFGDCPKYHDVTVLLSDEDSNGRFDHIHVIADQYVAGPYAEGPYEILLPITAAMIERLKPEYRPSFQPRPPVK